MLLTETILKYFNNRTDTKSKTMLAKYNSDCENYEKKYKKPFNFEKLIEIYKYDYTVFLTESYFGFFKKGLIKYFDKYKIAYYDYRIKDVIQNSLNMVAEYLKMPDNKYEEIKKVHSLNNFKIIYFLDNSIEPGLLYKKIAFSKEELFLSINNYIIKRLEYKLRTFCQIAEKLGAETIRIKSASDTKNIDKINIGLSAGQANLELSSQETTSTSSNINLIFQYTNFNLNLNLNKYYLAELIDNETEFFISRDEFSADIDLKFLIDSRCIGLIQKYSTEIIVKNINEIERKIMLKAMGYGLDLGHTKSKSEYTSISIDIDFIDIYKKPECITGYNLYVGKEGFWHLANIIKELESKNALIIESINMYYKIHNFMKSQLTSLSKKQFEIDISLETLSENPIVIYNNIMTNFKKSEVESLYYDLFKDNMTWNNFERIRNNILFNMTNVSLNNSEIVNKFYFIISQYHLINNNNKKFKEKMDTYIKTNWEIMLKNISEDMKLINLMELIKDKIDMNNLIHILNENKEEIIKIILSIIENSYLKWYGLEPLKSKEEIYKMLIEAIKCNFEIIFQNFQQNIIKEFKNTNNKIYLGITPERYNDNNQNYKKLIANISNEIDKYIVDNPTEKQLILNDLLHNKEKIISMLDKTYINTVSHQQYKRRTSPQERRPSSLKRQSTMRLQSKDQSPIKLNKTCQIETIKSKVIKIMNNIISNIIDKISTEIESNTIYHNNLYVKKFIAYMYIQYIDPSISFRKISKNIEIEFIQSIETYIRDNEIDNNYQNNKIFYSWNNFLKLVSNIGKNSVNRFNLSNEAINKIDNLNEHIVSNNSLSSSFRQSISAGETKEILNNDPSPQNIMTIDNILTPIMSDFENSVLSDENSTIFNDENSVLSEEKSIIFNNENSVLSDNENIISSNNVKNIFEIYG